VEQRNKMNTAEIRGLWKWVRVGFRKRLIVCFALVFGISLYNGFSYPIIRLAAAISTLVTAELFVVCYVPFYLSQMGLLFKTKTVDRPLPDEIVDLAKSMGLKIKKMKTLPNICNAYVFGKALFVGEDLLKKLDMPQFKAVCAHEFGHIKGKHVFIQFLYLAPIVAFLWLSWDNLPPVMMELGLFAYMMIVLIPIHWEFERRADCTSVRYVGKEAMKSALLAIEKRETMNEPSETHPPTSKRLKWIDEAGTQEP
jgi:Zn-dependent protease with chaperone function